jgi:hypothetical protein
LPELCRRRPGSENFAIMSGHISRLIIGESVRPRLSATIGIAGTESAVTSGHTCNDFRETSLEAMQSAWPCGKWHGI